MMRPSSAPSRAAEHLSHVCLSLRVHVLQTVPSRSVAMIPAPIEHAVRAARYGLRPLARRWASSSSNNNSETLRRGYDYRPVRASAAAASRPPAGTHGATVIAPRKAARGHADAGTRTAVATTSTPRTSSVAGAVHHGAGAAAAPVTDTSSAVHVCESLLRALADRRLRSIGGQLPKDMRAGVAPSLLMQGAGLSSSPRPSAGTDAAGDFLRASERVISQLSHSGMYVEVVELVRELQRMERGAQVPWSAPVAAMIAEAAARCNDASVQTPTLVGQSIHPVVPAGSAVSGGAPDGAAAASSMMEVAVAHMRCGRVVDALHAWPRVAATSASTGGMHRSSCASLGPRGSELLSECLLRHAQERVRVATEPHAEAEARVAAESVALPSGSIDAHLLQDSAVVTVMKLARAGVPVPTDAAAAVLRCMVTSPDPEDVNAASGLFQALRTLRGKLAAGLAAQLQSSTANAAQASSSSIPAGGDATSWFASAFSVEIPCTLSSEPAPSRGVSVDAVPKPVDVPNDAEVATFFARMPTATRAAAEMVMAAPFAPAVYNALIRAAVVGADAATVRCVLEHMEMGIGTQRLLAHAGRGADPARAAAAQAALSFQGRCAPCAATLRYSDLPHSTLLAAAMLFAEHGDPDDVLSVLRWHCRALEEQDGMSSTIGSSSSMELVSVRTMAELSTFLNQPCSVAAASTKSHVSHEPWVPVLAGTADSVQRLRHLTAMVARNGLRAMALTRAAAEDAFWGGSVGAVVHALRQQPEQLGKTLPVLGGDGVESMFTQVWSPLLVSKLEEPSVLLVAPSGSAPAGDSARANLPPSSEWVLHFVQRLSAQEIRALYKTDIRIADAAIRACSQKTWFHDAAVLWSAAASHAAVAWPQLEQQHRTVAMLQGVAGGRPFYVDTLHALSSQATQHADAPVIPVDAGQQAPLLHADGHNTLSSMPFDAAALSRVVQSSVVDDALPVLWSGACLQVILHALCFARDDTALLWLRQAVLSSRALLASPAVVQALTDTLGVVNKVNKEAVRPIEKSSSITSWLGHYALAQLWARKSSSSGDVATAAAPAPEPVPTQLLVSRESDVLSNVLTLAKSSAVRSSVAVADAIVNAACRLHARLADPTPQQPVGAAVTLPPLGEVPKTPAVQLFGLPSNFSISRAPTAADLEFSTVLSALSSNAFRVPVYARQRFVLTLLGAHVAYPRIAAWLDSTRMQAWSRPHTHLAVPSARLRVAPAEGELRDIHAGLQRVVREASFQDLPEICNRAARACYHLQTSSKQIAARVAKLSLRTDAPDTQMALDAWTFHLTITSLGLLAGRIAQLYDHFTAASEATGEARTVGLRALQQHASSVCEALQRATYLMYREAIMAGLDATLLRFGTHEHVLQTIVDPLLYLSGDSAVCDPARTHPVLHSFEPSRAHALVAGAVNVLLHAHGLADKPGCESVKMSPLPSVRLVESFLRLAEDVRRRAPRPVASRTAAAVSGSAGGVSRSAAFIFGSWMLRSSAATQTFLMNATVTQQLLDQAREHHQFWLLARLASALTAPLTTAAGEPSAAGTALEGLLPPSDAASDSTGPSEDRASAWLNMVAAGHAPTSSRAAGFTEFGDVALSTPPAPVIMDAAVRVLDAALADVALEASAQLAAVPFLVRSRLRLSDTPVAAASLLPVLHVAAQYCPQLLPVVQAHLSAAVTADSPLAAAIAESALIAAARLRDVSVARQIIREVHPRGAGARAVEEMRAFARASGDAALVAACAELQQRSSRPAASRTQPRPRRTDDSSPPATSDGIPRRPSSAPAAADSPLPSRTLDRAATGRIGSQQLQRNAAETLRTRARVAERVEASNAGRSVPAKPSKA